MNRAAALAFPKKLRLYRDSDETPLAPASHAVDARALHIR
jgi:hypothetical protein